MSKYKDKPKHRHKVTQTHAQGQMQTQAQRKTHKHTSCHSVTDKRRTIQTHLLLTESITLQKADDYSLSEAGKEYPRVLTSTS